MSLQRLRTDFQFTVLVLFCLVGVIGIAPFVVYRAAQGEWQAAIVDALIVASLGGALAYAWRGGSAARAGAFVVMSTTIACAVVSHVIGLAGAFWSCPVLIANFLLVKRHYGLVASIALIAAIVIDGGAFATMLDRLMYVSSASVGCVLAYVFARRTDLQRAQLVQLASRDPLTGVANRRAMDRELHIAAETFRRHRTPVGLLVMDLDHFKRVNDEFGHEAGDDVLVSFARVVQSRCRAGDRLFRYGGEEFVLLLPGTDLDTLQLLANELRAAVAQRVRVGDRPITVSVGGAVLREGEDNAQWLARADAAMYAAKRGGRDRVVVEG
ncbi:GGDEF domain-containing protein [Lysobacter claricitrinus]|uniref:GGDEF domain-containing protein n=1 Tax=Lysobacter claricitrinus TaxID=3367728 RepID=UPI0038B376AE